VFRLGPRESLVVCKKIGCRNSISDVEWVVVCAIRDEASVRAAAAWHGRVRNDLTNFHAEESLAT
jgi:hypothetical protein